MSLAGKTLFITGASRSIGKAIALRAVRDGANVPIVAKTEQPHPTLLGTICSADVETPVSRPVNLGRRTGAASPAPAGS